MAVDDFHRRMICGDPENLAWSNVPLYQAQYHLRAYLESKGYMSPSIELVKDQLVVDLGPQLRLEAIEVEVEVEAVSADSLKIGQAAAQKTTKELQNQLKKNRGSVLTPALLDRLEDQASAFYKNRGFACASAEASASIKTSTVRLSIEKGERRTLQNIQIEAPHDNFQQDYNMELLRRYYPFRPSTPYSLRALSLARKRIDESNIVSGNYFDSNCYENQTQIVHKFSLGPPRVLRFGFGADTEIGPFVYSQWEHSRFDSSFSRLQAQVSLSIQEQALETKGQFYPIDELPRFFYSLSPALSREERNDFEELSASVATRVGYQWDFDHQSLQLATGPDFEYTNFDQSTSDEKASDFAVAWVAESRWQNHRYELERLHPKAGFYQNNRLEFRSDKLGFFTNLLVFEHTSKQVTRLGNCGKGDCFLALRQNFRSTWLQDTSFVGQLAPSLQGFLGDVGTLRGWAIEDLDNPSLTQASLGFDLRYASSLWPDFEPYVFYDLGAQGSASWKLNDELFSGAGLGLRWFSPIGIVNAFLARANSYNSLRNDQWYFYLGLGGGF